MSIRNNYNIPTLTEEEINEDLAKNDLSPDLKGLLINELTRRRIGETKDAIQELEVAINEFNNSSERYSKRIVFLTYILVFLTLVLAIPVLKDFF